MLYNISVNAAQKWDISEQSNVETEFASSLRSERQSRVGPLIENKQWL